MVADVNGPKSSINDSLELDRGDQVLRAAARVLKASFRSQGLVARVGGTSSPSSYPGHASPRTKRSCAGSMCHQAIQQFDPGSSPPLSLAVGTAVAAWPDKPPEDAPKMAGRAIYTGKAATGSGYHRASHVGAAFTSGRRRHGKRGAREAPQRPGARLADACGLRESRKPALATLALVHAMSTVRCVANGQTISANVALGLNNAERADTRSPVRRVYWFNPSAAARLAGSNDCR